MKALLFIFVLFVPMGHAFAQKIAFYSSDSTTWDGKTLTKPNAESNCK